MAPAFFCAGAVGKRGLFPAGGGNPLDKLLLEDQIQNYHRQHGQQRPSHQDGEIGAELAPQSGQTGGEGHHVQVGVDNKRPHQVAVCKHSCEDGQGGHRGPRQGEHDLIKGLPLIAAVQIGGLTDLLGDAHVGLPQEKHTERADQARKNQSKDGIGQAHFGHHLILGNDEDLAGQGHLNQHNAEQQLFASEFQHSEGVARHGAERYRADHPEKNHQASVKIQLEERQTGSGFLKIFPPERTGKDNRGHRVAFCHCFEAGENHPEKGEYHDNGTQNQSYVGEGGHPFS